MVANFMVWSSRTLRQLSSETGLSFVQLLLIRNLATRGPMRMGEASEDLALADGVLTGVVDRLEERGLAERSKDPNDRRAILIGLTDAGKTLARSAMKPYEIALQQIFSEMDLEAVERFTEGFERLAKGEILAREVARR